jgi:Predicted RNA polymerase sigma factor containing a TPR repeat domain
VPGSWRPRGTRPSTGSAGASGSSAKLELLGHEARQQQQSAIFGGQPDLDAVVEGEGVADDLLRLMFISCHPILSTEARAALTLKLLGGLTTEEIARAFLSTEPAIAQRIVRPSAPWPASRSRSRSRRSLSGPRGWPRCSRSFT